MNLLFALYSVLLALGILGLLGALAIAKLNLRRCRHRDAVLRGEYLHILMLALMNGEEEAPDFPLLERTGGRMLLVETVAGVVDVTYGLDAVLLQRIVTHYGLDVWLQQRVHRSQGYSRARNLSLLGRLPGVKPDAVARYRQSRNRQVRFYLLLAQLSADPSLALTLLTEFATPLSAYEIAEILALLRRGMLPIAYEPLLVSPNRNLRAIGLGVVRQFGIEQAEKQLLHMVAHDTLELRHKALYTLCSMRCSLARREVVGCVAAMSPTERKALLRYMVFEGYAPSVLRRLFPAHETPYCELLVQSYKRSLA